MKANKENVIIRIPTGSRFYGTSGPNSDYDFKAITLPALGDLLLNKKQTNRKEKPEGIGPQGKVGADEVETEYIPIQIFLSDFLNGQTYALEMAFGIAQGLHESYDTLGTKVESGSALHESDSAIMKELIDKFLTRSVGKMMGYAISQAQLYGVKTERYASIKAVIDILSHVDGMYSIKEWESLTLANRPDIVERLAKIPHVKLIELLTGDGGDTKVPGIDVIGKQYPLGNKLVTVKKSLNNALEQYGERVKEFEGTGADWKALSHAIRICEQIIELCDTGKLTFPRPNAAFLKQVKSGQIDKDTAVVFLDGIFNEAEIAVGRSKLQLRTPELEEQFERWKIELLAKIYGSAQFKYFGKYYVVTTKEA